ncbi:MAG TPA: hypothetical protein PK400_00635 [Phycisphaerales bacterium]|nr:hypothetical protein [Phycisphaerales bacterium]
MTHTEKRSGALCRTRTYAKSALAVSPAASVSQMRSQAALADEASDDLREVVTAWSELPDVMRAAVLAIVRAGNNGSKR